MFEGILLAILPIYEGSGIVLYLLHAAIRVKVTEPGPHLEATDQQKLMVAGSPKKSSYFYLANGEPLNFWRLVGKLKFT